MRSLLEDEFLYAHAKTVKAYITKVWLLVSFCSHYSLVIKLTTLKERRKAFYNHERVQLQPYNKYVCQF